ncbi:MAG: PHP domain-containing protein [Nitrospiraceae bacterium]
MTQPSVDQPETARSTWRSPAASPPARVVHGVVLGLVLLGPAAVAGPVLTAAGAETNLQPLTAALHIHSKASTGTLSIDELAEQAERLGVEAVILSDNLVLRYEYGLPPLRGVIRYTVRLPSVLEYGLERFLAEIREAQARHPRVLLIPGVEVAPHYYWTGSLLDGTLTMHNAQKNLLVLGLARAEDYLALPVAGNPAARHYGWESLPNVLPGLLFVPAAWLWTCRRVRSTRVGMLTYCGTARYRGSAMVMAGTAALLLLNAWPFSQTAFSLYEEGLGYRPYQALIEAVTALGGVVVWSMPEARDFNQFSFGPLGAVTVTTEPYPEALLLTTGYTGFGGVYQDNRTVATPGGVWDQAIARFLMGERTTLPFAVGELAFHGPGHDRKELDQVLTILWVPERTQGGLLQALRAGRYYAIHQYRKEYGLRLDRFRVECQGGARGAESGEVLHLQGSRDLVVRISISATDHGTHPIKVTLVRSGQVVARFESQTPFVKAVADSGVPPGEWTAYRLEIKGEAELLSNPVFVGPG